MDHRPCSRVPAKPHLATRVATGVARQAGKATALSSRQTPGRPEGMQPPGLQPSPLALAHGAGAPVVLSVYSTNSRSRMPYENIVFSLTHHLTSGEYQYSLMNLPV